MTHKIFFWIGGVFDLFVVAKFIQEKYNGKLYSLIDATNKQKSYFQTQKHINFTQSWFYRDNVHVKNKNKIDIKYLEDFERRTEINLWKIVYMDQAFYKYNQFHHFNYNNILSIIEQECKFFESVLDASNPDFLVIAITDRHHSFLFSEICKSRGIKILMIGPSRIGLRVMVFGDAEKNTQLSEPIIQPPQTPDYEIDLKNYLTEYNSQKQITRYIRDIHKSHLGRVKRYLRRLWSGKNISNRDHFEYYGMTINKSMYVTLKNSIRKIQANFYLNRNTIKKLDSEDNFIYYPLHSEPERALSIVAPYFMNQIETITHIAKSIPVEYMLYVKDHPVMPAIGTRSTSFYKEIQNLPNVKLLHPSLDQQQILSKSSLVITISGTAGLEGTFHNKPTITFSDLIYSSLPSVFTVNNLEELPLLIRKALKTKVDPRNLIRFIQFVESNSCKSDISRISSSFRIHFNNTEINENEMKQLIKEFKPDFEALAKECLKKLEINYAK